MSSDPENHARSSVDPVGREPVDPEPVGREPVDPEPVGPESVRHEPVGSEAIDAGPGVSVRPGRSALVPKLLAEFVGTAFLVAGVVGSGIMAENLTDDVGLQLLQNAIATAGVLMALILALGPASGAHFNPVVTLVDRLLGGIDTPGAIGYVIAQISGGISGVMAANVMFALPIVEWSSTDRSAGHLVLAEIVATVGLLVVIFGVVRSGHATMAAFAVSGYIAGAYYFTSSTSFANPAVTIARTMSDSFAGIAPGSAPGFVIAELIGAAVALVVIVVIYPDHSARRPNRDDSRPRHE